MENNFNKTLSITLFVFGIIFLAIGSTFAYFTASITSNINNLSGGTLDFDASISIETIKNDELIPLDDGLVDDTLNSTHVCTDKRGYGLCSLYHFTLVNNSIPQVMTGYLQTVSTTYTTSNLKYQLFTYSNGTYTAVSDMKTVPITADCTSNFTMNNSNISVTLNDGTTTAYSVDYYLAIWLSDPGSNQLVDSNKTYSGSIVFVSANGNSISANFS